jgi:lipoprotein-anchoring transpeptidase ErfK/SrfK
MVKSKRFFIIFLILLFLPGSVIWLSGCFTDNNSSDVQDTGPGQVIAENSDVGISNNNPGEQDTPGVVLEENTEDGNKKESSNSSDNGLVDSSTEETDMNKGDEEPIDPESTPEVTEEADEESSEIPVTAEEKPEVAPELTLSVILGPEYAQDSQVCYYRVKAIVTGKPFPDITFSKDDSNGAWGVDVTQINLTEGQSYTLTCKAENPAGAAESTVTLNWIANPDSRNSSGDSQASPPVQVDYGDIDNFLIDVNLTLQQVIVSYRGNVIRNMVCSGGRPETPTPLGEYLTYQKIYYQYVPKFAQGAFYWTRFYGPYLFHSIPTDINRNMLVEELEKLGTPASHGCIRLMNEDAKWMYDVLPLGIRVNIHN